MRNHQLTGAPAPVTLDGNPYDASPLSDKSLDELELWIQGQVVRAAAAGSDDPEVIAAASIRAASISWMSKAGQRILNRPAGYAKLCELLLRPRHPKITYEISVGLMKEPKNIQELHRVFSLLMDSGEEKSDDNNEGDGDDSKN